MTKRQRVHFFAAGVVLGVCVAARASAQKQSVGIGSWTQHTATQVTGRVVDGDSGRAVGGAVVTLKGLSPGASSGLPVQRDLTVSANPQGLFTFQDVTVGSYSAIASAPGYLGGMFGQTSPLSAAKSLVVESEQHVDVVLRLWKNSDITGIVTNSVGKPLANVNVRAMRWENIAGRRRVVQRGTAKTDDQGRYKLDGLIPGEYVVWVPSVQVSGRTPEAIQKIRTASEIMTTLLSLTASAQVSMSDMLFLNLGIPEIDLKPGGGLSVYRSTFWPQGHSPSEGVSVVLAGDERASLDFQLEPVPTVRVSGRLFDDNGSVPGTAVRLLPAAADEFAVETSFETVIGISDGSGEFTLLGVPSGNYTLRVLTEPSLVGGFPPGTKFRTSVTNGVGSTTVTIPGGVAAPLPIPAGTVRWATLPLSVADANLSDIGVAVKNGFRLSGKVYFDGDTDGSTRASSQQLTLTLESEKGPMRGMTAAGRGLADSSGTVSTTAVPAGRYFIRTATLPQGWALKFVRLGSYDVTEVPAVIESDRDDLVIGLTKYPNRISGTVLAKLGPDPEASVLVFPVDSGLWTDYGIHPRRLVATPVSASGNFSIEAIPVGEYYIAAVHGARLENWRDLAILKRLSSLAERIQITDSSRLTKILRTLE